MTPRFSPNNLTLCSGGNTPITLGSLVVGQVIPSISHDNESRMQVRLKHFECTSYTFCKVAKADTTKCAPYGIYLFYVCSIRYDKYNRPYYLLRQACSNNLLELYKRHTLLSYVNSTLLPQAKENIACKMCLFVDPTPRKPRKNYSVSEENIL